MIGDDKILYIKRAGVFYPVGCLIDNSMSEMTDVINGNDSALNGWRDIRLTNQGYEITASALLDNRSDTITFTEIRQYKRSKVLIEWKISDGVSEEEGKGYITELSDTASVDEFISFTFKINGWGAIW